LLEVLKNEGNVFIVPGKLSLHFFQLEEDVFVREQEFPHPGKNSYDLIPIAIGITRMAVSLFKTLESIATPCSVNA